MIIINIKIYFQRSRQPQETTGTDPTPMDPTRVLGLRAQVSASAAVFNSVILFRSAILVLFSPSFLQLPSLSIIITEVHIRHVWPFMTVDELSVWIERLEIFLAHLIREFEEVGPTRERGVRLGNGTEDRQRSHERRHTSLFP